MDLAVVAMGIGICSILGLPWVVAATVLSLAHVQSLFVESTCTAPGERPKFLGVRYRKFLDMKYSYAHISRIECFLEKAYGRYGRYDPD